MAKNQGIKKLDFAKKMDISRQTLENWIGGGNINAEDVMKASRILDISVASLMDDKLDLELTGDGISTMTVKEEQAKYRRAGMIPLYDTIAVGGSEFLKADDAAVSASNFEWIHAGPFVGRATGAIRHYGDSMYEKFPSGCIIAYAAAPDWREYLHYGSDYVVETRDGYRVTKNIQPEKNDRILLVSHNTYKNKHGVEIFSPYTLPLQMIRSMSYVLGMVRFDASMQAFAVVEEQNKH